MNRTPKQYASQVSQVKTKTKKVIAIIPARGGSKGLPKKNIKMFCGKPLIYYTIKAAKRSKLFDRIIVSTDSLSIKKVAKKFGAEVPFLRPPELARDNSNIVDGISHLLKCLQKKDNYEPDIIFLLQPTSPLRTSEDIVASYQLFNKSHARALVSVCETHHEIWHIVAGKLKLVNSFPGKLVNRQERQPTYKQDGSMVYIIKPKTLLKNKSFIPEGTVPYVVPKWKAVDIDGPEDFLIAEVLYRGRRNFAQQKKL